MINNIIKTNDKIYLVRRILHENTSEEVATQIHHNSKTDTLLRDRDGKWFCCMNVKDAEFREVDLTSTNQTDYSHTQFELGDNGGLG